MTKDLPSGEPLCKIAAKISTNWKTKYYLFKLDNSDVENITQGCNRDNPVGQRLGYEHSKYTKKSDLLGLCVNRQEVLKTWRGREPSPTCDKLLVILVKGEWKEAQDVLVQLCTTKKRSHD